MKSDRRFTAGLVLAGLAVVLASASAYGEDRLRFLPEAGVSPAKSLKITREIRGKPTRSYPVSDIRLEIVNWEGSAREVLTMANSKKARPDYDVFYTDFRILANGMVIHDTDGVCGGWKDDLAACGIDDDGGHFWLRRKLAGDKITLTLILRREKRGPEDIAPALFRVGDWGETDFTWLEAANERRAEFSFTGPVK